MASSSNLASLRYLAESTPGVIAAGSPAELRFTSESLQHEITTDTSKEIRSDRQVADVVQLGASSTGQVQFEVSYRVADPLFEAALGGTWTAVAGGAERIASLYGLTLPEDSVVNEASNGVRERGFTLEKGFADVGEYIAHTGMAVDTLDLTFESAAILTGSLGFTGRTAVLKSGASNFTATATAPADYPVINTARGVGSILIDGVAADASDVYVQRVTLSVANNLRALQAVGRFGAVAIKPGTQLVTGTLEVYFRNGQLYRKYLAGDAWAMAWAAFDTERNGYGVHLPRVKANGAATVVAGGLDTDVVLSVPFQAVIDPVSGKTISMHRFGV